MLWQLSQVQAHNTQNREHTDRDFFVVRFYFVFDRYVPGCCQRSCGVSASNASLPCDHLGRPNSNAGTIPETRTAADCQHSHRLRCATRACEGWWVASSCSGW
jgi:hypothetical protein